MKKIIRLCAALLLLGATACDKKTDNQLFTALPAKETGVEFNNINVENENINILTYEYLYNGGGVAIGDINNDGLPDIYFTSNNLENKLYLNKGNFTFEDISRTAGVDAKKGWKTGACMADVNADGWLDIYVCRSADGNPDNRRNLLFINNGNLTFTEKAAEYGVDDDSYTTQAVFFDLDKDGDLDLFTLNHSLITISNKVGIDPLLRTIRKPYLSNRLFVNENGRFRDISDSAGIIGGVSNYGLGVMASDFNNDGWTDIYVTNDYAEHDHLYINNHNQTFTDVIETATGHVPHFSMGTDAADINRDGLIDFFAGDMLPADNKRQKLLYGPHEWDKFNIMTRNSLHYQYMRNMLQLNNGDGTFSEIGQLAGVSNTDWSWATLFADYDNDGWNDLFITNGYKRDFTNMDFLKFREDVEARLEMGRQPEGGLLEVVKKMPSNKIHNYIFRNNGNLQFDDKTAAWGFEEPVLSNGAAYADLDNDGDLDLVVNNMDAPAGIFRNNLEKIQPPTHYLKCRLKGNAGNTFGIGAKVRVYGPGFVLEREQQPVRGFQSAVDFTLHFGLGTSGAYDSVLVIWPSGKYQKLPQGAPDQTLVLEENAAGGTYAYPARNTRTVFKPASTGGLDWAHTEDDYTDYVQQSTLPCFQSRMGPHIARADVNNDGRTDLFATGAKGQSSVLYLQQAGGTFRAGNNAPFEAHKDQEFVDAVFFDADGDRDPDLLAVAGGYAFDEGSPVYTPRLYTNDGKGSFSDASQALPALSVNGSCATAADIDADGDQDLFIGGAVKPENYPLATPCHVLLNDGAGRFSDATEQYLPEKGMLGITSDAILQDLDGDKLPELLVAGAYTPVRLFKNIGGKKLEDQTASYIAGSAEGWWNTLLLDDLDNDGDLDLLAGNWGMNNQMKVDASHPAVLMYKDFDKNGTIDPIPGYTIQGKMYPGLSLDELTFQLPMLKKRFQNYESYSEVNFDALFESKDKEGAGFLHLNSFETTLWINDGSGHFAKGSLPVEAQMSPVYAIAAADVNGDGQKDILMCGNQSTTRISMGRMDANYGLLLLGKGNNAYEAVPQYRSGLSVKGDVRDIVVLPDNKRVLFVRNNDAVSGWSY